MGADSSPPSRGIQATEPKRDGTRNSRRRFCALGVELHLPLLGSHHGRTDLLPQEHGCVLE